MKKGSLCVLPVFITADPPVDQSKGAVHPVEEAGVVRGEQKRCSFFGVQPTHKIDQPEACFGVEIRRPVSREVAECQGYPLVFLARLKVQWLFLGETFSLGKCISVGRDKNTSLPDRRSYFSQTEQGPMLGPALV